jgi:hypothetical protein
MAGLAQNLFRRELVVEGEGRRLDDDAGRHVGGGDLGCDRVERLGIRQAGNDHRRLGHHVFHMVADRDARLLHFLAAGRIGVDADDLPAIGDQVAREGAAHDAEPNDTNHTLACHDLPPLRRVSLEQPWPRAPGTICLAARARVSSGCP